MQSAELRRRFLEYFEQQGHAVRPSSSLIPADDPTLLFTNAGMVQFKKVFLGAEKPAFGARAATSQKCVRAGGKHNDLEQVGHTARHHTFFEMLGNFSFGDYFKRDAIRFAWEFITDRLKIDPKHIRVTVFDEDEEARALWREVAGLADSRIYGLGAHDNFWQMADTGPCGPCSEIFVDLARIARDFRFPEAATGDWTEIERDEFSLPAFVEGTERGRFLEIWNLVFMQFDRQPDGKLVALPKPSVDTGMGLDRTAAALQGVTSNYHTDLFEPLIATIEQTVGLSYRGRESDKPEWHDLPARGRGTHSAAVKDGRVRVDPAAFRVLADHGRAVAFLLADGVFPSNEGRGYVLRRILRRAVRHAWLLGRVSPTLVDVTNRVIDVMGDVYPELRARRSHILDTTRAEEQRFLATIDAGMRRFDEIAPAATTQGSGAVKGTIAGEDAFRLHDTYGFPLDLTELMARERGYTVDVSGFEAALAAQRAQSQQERKSRNLVAIGSDSAAGEWTTADNALGNGRSAFVGYDRTDIETEAIAVRELTNGRVAVILRESPFYAQSGGQISDQGSVVGDGWELEVDDVRKSDEGFVVSGLAKGSVTPGRAHATVPRDVRLDTERNHTATHLLHAALRHLIGDHVHQAGSLVAPDRLRFDFTHHGPLTAEQIDAVTEEVNRGILSATPLAIEQRAYSEAVAAGAMALFGEKYGDVVRVVSIPGVSAELCGGTHVRNTAEIGLFRIVGETGVAAGVRRIEAVTGPRAYEIARNEEKSLREIETIVRAAPGAAPKRIQSLVEERRTLERKLEEALRSGGGEIDRLLSLVQTVDGTRVVASQVSAEDSRALTTLGDALRDRMQSGVAVLAASFADGKSSLLGIVSDDLRERGLRADEIVREVAAVAGGRGGGKPHMAQAGVPDASRIPDALAAVVSIVRSHLSRN
ncbi:MAG TPA: alanine--tRNA ligase [Gemmatimonadaceae bacterium]